ncbi:ATP-binding protein [Saccharicrinis fermentans]|uniref:Ferredoxin n=1 Tax=Saccharicrinis fermentans DSM 9555 = JCM 21142 TaxID=869213 RepID=W7YCU9_9BACT|nr:ATP-binding protein [Saccharicrinis fermentans]GAF05303.1 ferredoxin [Saccharicrinis fermentans DSM 9555 = JCM 21142]
MKEITILSGKGGTGKTTVTAALASLAGNAVLCDNDVDAADLHLILDPKIQEEHVYEGAWQASIHQDECEQCQLCMEKCRFDAIHLNKEGYPEVNPFQCEGCRLCERICPAQAITSVQSKNNHWFVSSTRFGSMVHAKMGPGEENSGKLVSVVRKKAKEIATENTADFIINDGPPGIGCSAISALSGTDLVVLVTEPSKSGLYDAKRLVELAQSFDIPIGGVINKEDINTEMSDEIVAFFASKHIPLLAKIPFNKEVVKAMVKGETITEFNDHSVMAQCIHHIWNAVKQDDFWLKPSEIESGK